MSLRQIVWIVAPLLLCGCQPRKTAVGLAGLPPSGKVRIAGDMVSETVEAANWQWDIVGDRNWLFSEIQDHSLILKKSYALNSRDKSGGTHLWSVELSISRVNAGQGLADGKATLRLRSSTGSSTTMTFTVPLRDGKALGSAKMLASGDQLYGVPGHTDLFAIDGKRYTLEIKD